MRKVFTVLGVVLSCQITALEPKVFAEALYWRSFLDQTSFAYTMTDPNHLIPLNGQILGVPMKWSWGGRAGISIPLPYDEWALRTTYLYFSNTGSRSTRVAAPALLGIMQGYSQLIYDTFDLTTCREAYASAETNLQLLDLVLYRTVAWTKQIAIATGFGLEGALLRTSDRSMYTGGGDIFVAPGLGNNVLIVSNDTQVKSLGPSFGFSTHWNLPQSFSLFCKIVAALHIGSSDSRHYEKGSGDPNRYIRLNKGYHRMMSHTMLNVGIDYTITSATGPSVTTRLGYETHQWGGAFRPFALATSGNVVPAVPSDLGLSGLTFRLTVQW